MPSGRSSLLPSLGIQTRCTGLGWYSPLLSLACKAGSHRWLCSRYRRHLRPSGLLALLPLATLAAALCRFSIFQTLSIRLNHLPPLIPLSRVANIRSVHTLASVHSHLGWTSLLCLASGCAFGTLSRSSNCERMILTVPPSYPPWLRGRYPLHRYYGGSDSCPAPFCTRTGILDCQTCTSRHPVSTHPMRPAPGDASCSRSAWPPIRFGRYRRYFGLRTLLVVSSVA